MKKILCIVLATAVSAGFLCACNTASGQGTDESTTPHAITVDDGDTEDTTGRLIIADGDTTETDAKTEPSDSGEPDDTTAQKDTDKPDDTKEPDDSDPAPVGSVNASGSFKSNTGSKYLNVLVKWKAVSVAEGIKLTADVYLTSWTVLVPARDNHLFTINEEKMTFSSPRIEVNDQYAESPVTTIEKILPATATEADLSVDFYYNGRYTNVEYKWLTASETVSFVN